MIKNQNLQFNCKYPSQIVTFDYGEGAGEACLLFSGLTIVLLDVQGQKTKEEKQVTNCKVLKQQPDCFFFTYCAQYGLALLWQFRNLKCCQEKQTKPSRENKWMKK